MIATLRLILIGTCFHIAIAYKIYQQRIPNGDAVPHPCKPNNIWEGVGHFLDEGAGYRNPFGLDFEMEGKKWTSVLCRKDSDGDGMTNGQELGDPDCVWQENKLPSRLKNISHPGICDPYDSPFCKAKKITNPKYQTQMEWLEDECQADHFTCTGIDATDVQTVNMTVNNNTKVPAKETIYMCQIFNFEQMAAPGDYHVIAVQPILDNRYVIHHIVLFGCTDDEVATPEPFECGMSASHNCSRVISIWTVGLSGDCFHPQTGITIGNKGYKRIAVELHWNNPDARPDWKDSSGMMLHFTPNKRQYEASFMITGHEHFILPPLQPSVVIKSTCPSACTRKMLVKPVWITLAWNHMHYAGVQMSVQVKRNNTSFYLSNDASYSYDSPNVFLYMNDPVQLLPGDELVTTCTFTTAKRTKSTFWGEATLDEMCYGFMIYYPKENAPGAVCFTSGPDVSRCDTSTYQGCSNLFNYSNTEWLNSTQMYHDLVSNCRRYGPCIKECLDTILRLKKNNPCLNGEIFDYIKYQMWSSSVIGQELLSLFSSCDIDIYKALNVTNTTAEGNNMGTATKPFAFTVYIVIALVFSICIKM
ncbi:MOXD1 homolog 1-like [Biomphalaria glabrata]|uniref:MOXD1 homolog 1-like n=2 Tax=Biomphalaria glabrata TaxID=6526 RepID=A0A9W2YIG0_BIOGL|nr:MOXD1 homolog 1-like [Biomphalaria glabrata]